MASNYMDGPFYKLWDEAQKKGLTLEKEKAARQWAQDQAKKVNVYDPVLFMKEYGRDFKRRQMNVGQMYLFRYDAKLKNDPKKLPYWDSYPLVFVIEDQGDSFLSLNLHYLPPAMRARLLDALHSIATNKKYNDNQKLALNYQLLVSSAKFRWFAPCVKRHLKSHIISPFYKISSEFWSFAIFLPLEQFNRKSKSYVWKESAKIIAKRR